MTFTSEDSWKKEIKDLTARLAEAERPPCGWKYDSTHYKWDTACGHGFYFEDGDWQENQCAFCMYCGGKIIEAAKGGRDE